MTPKELPSNRKIVNRAPGEAQGAPCWIYVTGEAQEAPCSIFLPNSELSVTQSDGMVYILWYKGQSRTMILSQLMLFLSEMAERQLFYYHTCFATAWVLYNLRQGGR